MEEKRNLDVVSIVGAVACGIVLVVMFIYNTRRQQQYQQSLPPPAPVTSAPAAEDGAGDAAKVPVAAQGAVPVAAEAVGTLLTIAAPADPVELPVAGEFVAFVDPTGLGVKAVRMEKYTIQTKDESRKDEKQLIGKEPAPYMALQVKGSSQLYEYGASEADDHHVSVTRIDAGRNFAFKEEWRVGEGGKADKSYEIYYTLTVTNIGTGSLPLPQMSLDCGALPPFLSDEQNTSFSNGVSGGVAYGPSGKNKAVTLSMKDVTKKLTVDKLAQYGATPLDWVTVGSKYFLFVLRNLKQDGQPASFAGFDPSQPQNAALLGGECFHAKAVLPGNITLAPGQSITWSVDGYAGPKDFRRLQMMGQNIASIMGMDLFFFGHFGWMGWICRVLLECLIGIASCFNAPWGYGIGIIVITLAVKIIFLPLSWKSTRDMRKMSALMPELKALREKYKGDAQRMYYEQQKLYKERGVSQMGGCLPMLVQIPVFFAMFNTFRSAIEIRNASFLWAADLSMPDAIFGLPIHPLALLTGATLFFQQKLTPSADPNQARMMNIMSLVFVFFFYQMPAALTLYMTVNSLFTIAQMLLFKRWEKKAAA